MLECELTATLVFLILPVRLKIVFVLRAQDGQITFFRSLGSEPAIYRRYTDRRFLRISYCYLQGITVRPVSCNYCVTSLSAAFTAVTRVQIPSGTPKFFRSLRGTATFGAGTRRHNSVANFLPGLPNRECFRASGAVLVGTKGTCNCR